MSNPIKAGSTEVKALILTEQSPSDPLDRIFEALFYEDGKRKLLTLKTMRYVREIQANVNEGDSLLVEGMLRHQRATFSPSFFYKAEDEGCTHPLLYYYFGESSFDAQSCQVAPLYRARAYVPPEVYYTKAIGGMLAFVHCWILADYVLLSTRRSM